MAYDLIVAGIAVVRQFAKSGETAAAHLSRTEQAHKLRVAIVRGGAQRGADYIVVWFKRQPGCFVMVPSCFDICISILLIYGISINHLSLK